MKNLLLVLSLAISLTGCTWVELNPSGAKVRVATAEQVQSCEKKGKTTVSVKAEVAGIDRDYDTVKTELETLARNSAVDLDGDTVVPATKIINGKQVFSVYRCNP